ncbi:hypothetical protein FBY14_102362 [Azospirillum brasilense]|nr:hypothetical protein [Azospirillum sp. TSH58]TWA93185.1 hypothetical protein FBY14_102362 [Azospirillum brasilense]
MIYFTDDPRESVAAEMTHGASPHAQSGFNINHCLPIAAWPNVGL